VNLSYTTPVETRNLRALCARSRKPATKPCTRCMDAPSSTEHPFVNVLYCSSECQNSTWNTHKALCNHLENRKLLYRAGSILQENFYVFKERTFDRYIFIHLCEHSRFSRITISSYQSTSVYVKVMRRKSYCHILRAQIL
jgi:hypothetical protein